MYIIAGLGNPTKEYDNTRHNIGFAAIDALADKYGISVSDMKNKALMGKGVINGNKVMLLKPLTYMNLSGNAVRYWVAKLKLPLENLIVICDDLNLPFGTLRMRKKGSDGGHNGLKNIQELIGTQEYPRIRIGIGNNFQKGGQVNFVIGEMSDEEKNAMPEICDQVINGVKDFTTIGIDRAMNSFNTAKKKTPESGV